MTRIVAVLFLGAALPAALFSRSTGAPVGHSNVPSTAAVDNTPQPAQACTRCHTTFPLNSQAGGSVRIQSFNYKPGQKQTIRVTVSHPEAARWGFQLTARRATDLNQRAGTFSLTSGIQVFCADIPAGRPVTADQPCPSAELEFATHNPDSTLGGTNGTKVFDVEWTPPDSDVGDVAFYAAGNAANASNNNQGDRIYSSHMSIEVDSTVRTCPSSTRPTLRGIGNAASGVRDVSVNSLISIYGTDFVPSGTQKTAGASDLRDGYPREMACVAVEIGGARAPLTYVRPDQINAQVPTLRTSGDTPVRVILNPGRPNQVVSDVANVRIVSYSPGLFTFNGTSAAAVNNADGTYIAMPAVVSGARPARPGDIIQLYATGAGLSDPVWQAGELPTMTSPLSMPVTVTLGGTALAASDVLYQGVVPGAISGLYQMNIRVPASAPDGNLPLLLTVGGTNSIAGTTLPVQR